MAKLLVGAGKACMTPPLELFPFESYSATPWEGVHDDCHVRAVVIDNGQTRAAIVTFELCILPPPEETRAIISEVGNVPPENVFMCSTHNHCVPYTRRSTPVGGMKGQAPAPSPESVRKMDYFTEWVWQAARKAVAQAAESLRPASYGFGRGESYINVNRDKQFEDGNWMQEGNQAAYSDKTLSAIKFVDDSDQVIAVVLNYAAHAIIGFMSKDFDGKVKVSSDFVGVTCGYVERRLGNGAVCLWTPAAEGNQNPIFTPFICVYEDDGYATHKNLPDGSAYIIMESIGQQHAVDAIGVLKGITEYSDTMTIQSADTLVHLPAQKAPEGADMRRNRMMADNMLPRNSDGTRPEKKLVKMLDDPEHPYAMPMQLLKLGDIAMVGVPNEIYAEIGRDMKLVSPVENTFIVTHTDSRYIGYIADKKSGHHNVFQSFGPVKPGACDHIIIGGMLEMFGKILP